MASEIRKTMDEATKNNNVKVIVITGTGRGFCAGADMDSLNSIDADEREKEQQNSPYSAFDDDWPLDFQRAQTWFPSVPKPIIAAVNGPAAGLGMILSMWCDIRFASKSAIFFAISFFSTKPACSSWLACCAILKAASTVFSNALSLKSELLALPFLPSM